MEMEIKFFKREEELRKEFEEIIGLATSQSLSKFLEHFKSIEPQKKDRQEQIARVKEEAFQKYWQSYCEYKEKILALQKIADEALGEIEKQAVTSMTIALDIK